MRLFTVALITAMLALATAATDGYAAEFGPVPGSFDAAFTGTGAGQAGAAANLEFGFRMNQEDPADPNSDVAGTIRDLHVDLPRGLVANPTAFERCPIRDIYNAISPCPREAAVGMVELALMNPGVGPGAPPPAQRLYRTDTQGNEVDAFAFNAASVYIVRMGVTVSPEGGYRIRATSINTSEAQPMLETKVTLWGIPAEHQGEGPYGFGMFSFGGPMPASTPRRRFISVPTRCDGDPLSIDMSMDSWSPSLYAPVSVSAPIAMPGGCDQLGFEPTIRVEPSDVRAGAPSGYRVDVEVPQNEDDLDGLETPLLRDAVVTLPVGVRISPPQAAGLVACNDSQFGLNEDSKPGCPGASKIGEIEIASPVLDRVVPGNVFIGEQLSDDPASGEMFRIFVTGRIPGVRVKLRGNVKSDPETGQLTASFVDNPELPFSRFTLWFKGGDRAPLVNPDACGSHRSEATFTPWGGPVAEVSDEFVIEGNCVEGGFEPRFAAGTVDPAAGAETSFELDVSRRDREQEFRTIDQIRLPEGLLGKVGSVTLCEAAAADRGDCPQAARVGRVEIAAGAGNSPLWVPQAGKEPTAVYLTGPYHGAPYGLSIVVPAQAGPFDLGTVVVRSALHVDERTAAITTGIDETRLYGRAGNLERVIEGAMPRMLKGVNLNQRQIRVVMDRDGFMVNPTDCSQMQISARLSGYGGASVGVANRFRATDCARLGFAPRLTARILDKGRKSTLRSFHPRTRFVVSPREGDANIGGARVVLPSSTLLDQANIGTTCTRAQMAARACPAKSIVGYARAWSPLLARTVEGPVYLAANGGIRPLPDLAAVLEGEIRVVLQGEISTLRTGGKARLQNTFRVVPDAPVSRFVLTVRGGKNTGLLVNSTDLCRSSERGLAVFQGQNGRTHRLRPRIATTFKGCRKVRRQAARKTAARKAARKAASRSATMR